MKRILIKSAAIILIVLITLFLPLSVSAAESEYNGYLNSFDLSSFDILDNETKSFLDELGAGDFDYESLTGISFQKVINHISKMITERADGPVKSGIVVICFIILTSFFKSMNNELNRGEISNLFSTISSLAISIFLIVKITDCIAVSSSAIKLCSDFSFAFFPAFCIIVASSGGIATSFSVNTMLLTLSQGLNYINSTLFVPVTNCFLALGICSGIRQELNISSVVDALKKLLTGLISSLSAIFVSILSLKTTVSGNADALGLQSVQFTINSVVPIIGGSISEGLLSIQNYSSLIKSSVGVVGIIAIALIFLPAIIEVNLWRLTLYISSLCAEVFGDSSSVTTIKAFSNTLMIIDVILILSMVTTIISIGILVAARTVN